MITIELTQDLNVKVLDAKGVEHAYELKQGLNDVPPEVAGHWYVKKFSRPVRRVPRVVVPSHARRGAMPASMLAKVTEAAAAIAEKPAAPAPAQTADVPAAKDAKAKA